MKILFCACWRQIKCWISSGIN